MSLHVETDDISLCQEICHGKNDCEVQRLKAMLVSSSRGLETANRDTIRKIKQQNMKNGT